MRTLADAIDQAARLQPAGRRLNVGCGHDHREGWVNVDLAALSTVDVAARFGSRSLPFPDGSFSQVLAADVIEHVDFTAAMSELHRVMIPGGVLIISTVHFSSRNLFVDPTHVRAFSARTFDYVVAERRTVDRSYYFDFSFASVETHIQFSAQFGQGRYLVWDRLLEPLVNSSTRVQDLYEMTGWSRMFPAANVLSLLVR